MEDRIVNLKDIYDIESRTRTNEAKICALSDNYDAIKQDVRDIRLSVREMSNGMHEFLIRMDDGLKTTVSKSELFKLFGFATGICTFFFGLIALLKTIGAI